MDDKAKMLQLYERMNRIKLKTSDLINSIDIFEDELQKAISINDKGYRVKQVSSNKEKLKEVKKAVKYSIINHIKNYL